MALRPISVSELLDSDRSRCPILAEWADHERMSFLTSFPAPDDLNARQQMMDFWSKAVTYVYSHAEKLSLDPEEVSQSLTWEGVIAPALGLSIRSLIASGKLVPRAEVEIGKGIARRLVETPLTYLMGMLSLGGSQESLPSGQYVHMDVLEDAAKEIVRHCEHLPDDERSFYLQSTEKRESQDRMTEATVGEYSPCSFSGMCRAASGSNPEGSGSSTLLNALAGEDLMLMARHLVRTKRAVSESTMIKIAGRGRGRALTALPISETDRDLLRLRCTVASLQTISLDLARRIEERRRDAAKANRAGQRREALVHLRRMKECQAARDNRLNSLYTLEKALDQVKKLRVDKQVLEAHDAATKALKSCREAHGLSVEKVDDVMDALAEEMAEQEGIAEALGRNDPISRHSDEKAGLELELELENLFREEVGEPDPPTHSSLEMPTGKLDAPPLPTKLEGQPKHGDAKIGATCDHVVQNDADADAGAGAGAGAGADAEEGPAPAPLRGSRPDVQVSVPVPLPS